MEVINLTLAGYDRMICYTTVENGSLINTTTRVNVGDIIKVVPNTMIRMVPADEYNINSVTLSGEGVLMGNYYNNYAYVIVGSSDLVITTTGIDVV